VKGLNIIRGEYLETVNNDSTSLSLLGRGGNIEMMKQTIAEGKLFLLIPSDDEDVQEFFYILEGNIEAEIDGVKVKLGPHDFISAKNLTEPVHLKTVSKISMLSISTAPVFHYMSDVIQALREVGEAVEQKDRYTFKHSSRVADYAVKTAAKMKLSKERTQNLYLASIFHDIGKINIPEEVLKKPDKLTDEEFALVKKHPGDGADMLRKTAYADLADIVEQHHERLNGRGYPFGLKDGEILMEAKIIGVCDTFDAMTEDRAYRKAFTAEYAMTELKERAGSQYDAAVVGAFEQVLKEEGKIV
jgi:putative nucleotidyltransferase with HDIG domain